MDTKHQLRLGAYAVTDAGHIQCFNEARPDERTAVIRIDIAEDSKAGRELVEQLLSIIDEPRTLRGTARNGSVIVLFRHGDRSPVPHIQGASRTGVFEMATHDGGVRFTIACRSDGETIDTAAYSWGKRSPLEVESFRLPVLTDDLGAAVVREAFRLDCNWAEAVEQRRADKARTAQLMADIASGKRKIPTEAEREAAEDNELVAAYAGQDISYSDGVFACNVLAARKRVALRKQQAAAA